MSSRIVNVVIDSNIWRSNPKYRTDGELISLSLLSKGKHIKFLMPEITLKEFTSQRTEHISNAVNSVTSGVKRLKRLGFYHMIDDSGTTEDSIKTWPQDIMSIVENDFRNWLNDIEATILPIEPDDGRLVMDAYFDGSPPFKQPKNRNDIPDAFIWVAIERLIKQDEQIHFIGADKGMERSFTQDVKLHSTLKEFLTSQEIKNYLTQIQRTNEQILLSRVVNILSSDYDIVYNVMDNDFYDMVDQLPIRIDHIRSALSDPYISEFDHIEIDDLNLQKAIVLPGGVISLDVEFTTEITLEYWIEMYGPEDPSGAHVYYPDLELNNSAKRYTGHKNGYMIEIAEDFPLSGKASISISLDSPIHEFDFSTNDDSSLLSCLRASFDRLDQINIAESVSYGA